MCLANEKLLNHFFSHIIAQYEWQKSYPQKKRKKWANLSLTGFFLAEAGKNDRIILRERGSTNIPFDDG